MGNRESLNEYVRDAFMSDDHNIMEELDAAKMLLNKAHEIVVDFICPYSNIEAPFLVAAMMTVSDAIKANMDASDLEIAFQTYRFMQDHFDFRRELVGRGEISDK